MLVKVSQNKTIAHDEIEMLEICRLDVLTQDREMFQEKSDDRFVISIHSSVQRKNTSEIIRFGRVVKIHEFIEYPEFESHDRLESHDKIESPERLESHVKFVFHERILFPEKSEFTVPEFVSPVENDCKSRELSTDNKRFISQVLTGFSICPLVSYPVCMSGGGGVCISAKICKKF